MKDITLDGIIDKFEDSSLSELDVSYKDLHVICKRYATASTNNETSVTYTAPPIKENKEEESCKIEDKDKYKTINSPLVGTFYTAPSPDSPAFVKQGDKISKGDTLCILEAMKMMNELTAEDAYTIVEILSPEGALVEYGQPLFKVIA
jgi:acetyl-CoA carboxylase biotin carboxyl carrier protein